jgi:hypothetical protein
MRQGRTPSWRSVLRRAARPAYPAEHAPQVSSAASPGVDTPSEWKVQQMEEQNEEPPVTERRRTLRVYVGDQVFEGWLPDDATPREAALLRIRLHADAQRAIDVANAATMDRTGAPPPAEVTEAPEIPTLPVGRLLGVFGPIGPSIDDLVGHFTFMRATAIPIVEMLRWLNREERLADPEEEQALCNFCGRAHSGLSLADLVSARIPADDPYQVMRGELLPDGDQPPTGKGDPLADVYGAFDRTMSAIDDVLAED